MNTELPSAIKPKRGRPKETVSTNKVRRSVKVHWKVCNSGKYEACEAFRQEAVRVATIACEYAWTELRAVKKVESLLSTSIIHTLDLRTELTARAVQCAVKAGVAIAKGTLAKHKRRVGMESKLREGGQIKEADKLAEIIAKTKSGKPTVDKDMPIWLDGRFVKLGLKGGKEFSWVSLSTLWCRGSTHYNPASPTLHIPFKSHRQLKHWKEQAIDNQAVQGIRLAKDHISISFDIPVKLGPMPGKVNGVDIGITRVVSDMRGYSPGKDIHGHTLNTIMAGMTKLKRASKAYGRAQAHRTNFIHAVINKGNLFKGTSLLAHEDIKHLRKSKATNRYLSRWTYRDILGKLKLESELRGVPLVAVKPAFTSQRCSAGGCGWTQKANRKGESFCCKRCGHTAHADEQAPLNIGRMLQAVPVSWRTSRYNRVGFYWNPEGTWREAPAGAGVEGEHYVLFRPADKLRISTHLEAKALIVPAVPLP